MFTLIAAAIQKGGIVGVAFLMLIENLVPIIPSELIMPMAGFDAAQGDFSPVWAAMAGAAASIVGGIAWYVLGRSFGLDRMRHLAARSGRWLPFSAADVERGNVWFRRWGAVIVCLGRTLPGIRGFICIPAGIAKMPFWSFVLWSSLGASIWSALLVGAGYLLRQHFTVVEQWLNPVTNAFIVACIIVYGVRVARYNRTSER